jgi:hypothetical protein
MFAPEGWGVCDRERGWFWCKRAQRLAGDRLDAGLAVGVGSRPGRSGAMGVRGPGSPGGVSADPPAAFLAVPAVGVAGERVGGGMMAGAARRELNARAATGAARAGKGTCGWRPVCVRPPTRGMRR